MRRPSLRGDFETSAKTSCWRTAEFLDSGEPRSRGPKQPFAGEYAGTLASAGDRADPYRAHTLA
jgi:hypothetical protein